MTVPLDDMTTEDLLVYARQEAHPADSPSSEHASLIDELSHRLRRLHHWRIQVVAVIDPFLSEEDGTDLIPDYVRIENMIERIRGKQQ